MNFAHAGTMWFYDKSGNRSINPSKEAMRDDIRRDNPMSQVAQRNVFDFILLWVQPFNAWIKTIAALTAQGIESKKGHSLKYYSDRIEKYAEVSGCNCQCKCRES